MDFTASETENNQIGDGTLLTFHGPNELCGVGGSYHVTIDKDHRFTMTIDAMGRLMTGDGRVLNDVVADVTIAEERFGMIRCEDGPWGPQWRVNGPPYGETFAPLPNA